MTDMHVPTEITSSHIMFSLRGVSKCVYHAPGFLIKCRGSLVVRPPGIPEIIQNLPDDRLPEAVSAQAFRIFCQKSPAEASKNENDVSEHSRACFRFFIPRSPRVIHESCTPSGHNQALRETAPCRYHPFCRSLVAC